jgi:hypothetical protein
MASRFRLTGLGVWLLAWAALALPGCAADAPVTDQKVAAAADTGSWLSQLPRESERNGDKCLCTQEDARVLIERDKDLQIFRSQITATGGPGGPPGYSKEVSCNGGNGKQPCPIPVKVVVGRDANGKPMCEAWLNYCRLCVKNKKGEDPAKIKFELLGEPGFKFAPAGVDIHGATAGTRRHFKFNKPLDKVHVWDAGDDQTDDPNSTPPFGLFHDARVVSTVGNLTCKPRDPIIVNTWN